MLMTGNFVPNFKPSTHGLPFDNTFPKAPVVSVNLPGLGEKGFGDASGGLCGGMVFMARDLFEAGIAPPSMDTPREPGSPLHKYLCDRLLASFNLPSGVLKYYEWMTAPDTDSFLRHSPAARTVNEEWPAIRAELDAGRLAALGLVTEQSFNPSKLGDCHQVLAYGYQLNEATSIARVFVYDPNVPRDDNVTLMLDMNKPSLDYSADASFRGFFLTPYSRDDPARALGSA